MLTILLQQGTVNRISTVMAGIAVSITIYLYMRSMRKKDDNNNQTPKANG